MYVNEPVLRDEKTRKLAPHWKGPLVIEEVASPHSLRLRDPATQKELPSLIHVDRVKKCWADPETILAPQPARLNPLQPSAVVEQKGARYRVQFVANDGSMESSTRWLKESEVPNSLLSAWRVDHRKDGGVRLRRQNQHRSNSFRYQ